MFRITPDEQNFLERFPRARGDVPGGEVSIYR